MTGFLWGEDADAFFEAGTSESFSEKGKKKTARTQVGTDQDSPLTVTQLNTWIKRTLEKNISTIWIEGEIGSLTRSNAGHIYLTLKDSESQIACVVWRSTLERIDVELSEGMAVLVQGRLDVYPPRGNYQLVIQRVEQQGLGALQAAFKRLFQRLAKEGLFAQERKKSLPAFPLRIGFVTSPAGAAIHDFNQVLKRRWPLASVLIIPARVQGDGAAEDIVRGIEIAAKIRPQLDVLVVGRGGGSQEDLWCFNEEIVVRAIANSPLPTISAVGHEIDVTLSDLAADVRALTPSEAAEVVAPHREELLEQLEHQRSRLNALMQVHLQQRESRLFTLVSRPIIQEPERLFESVEQHLDQSGMDLERAITSILDQWDEKLRRSAELLEALSPLRTLARGYSITSDHDSGRLISQVGSAKIGSTIITELADGKLISQVQTISRKRPE